MRVVQVSVSRAAFADTLGAMRDWLDRNNRPLVRFETQTEGETIILTMQFDDDALADAFRQAFGGSEAI
jgi:hypothetical protein